MHPLINIATNAARQAGDLIIRYREQLERVKVSEKNTHDFFSEVDVKAEQMIVNTILKAYPDHGIIAEESGSFQEDADTIWIIDPLDGTGNYLRGYPFYGVSIAVMIRGKIEHGVIFDPLHHECFYASRGAGARLNDRRIRVSKQSQLSKSTLGTGFHNKSLHATNAYLPAFNKLASQCGSLRRSGSAALELAYVACGRLDGFWEFGLNIWDCAAGVLLIQEAGGFVSDDKGHDKYLDSGNIVAGAPKIFSSLLQTISSS